MTVTCSHECQSFTYVVLEAVVAFTFLCYYALIPK